MQQPRAPTLRHEDNLAVRETRDARDEARRNARRPARSIMSDYSQAGSSGQPDDYSSPFDVDLGGQQRASLRSELRQMRVERDNADETRSLLETQVELLRTAQRDAGVAARVDGWRRRRGRLVDSARG